MLQNIKKVRATYKYYNSNPLGRSTGDCVIRAITKATNMSWNSVYRILLSLAYKEKDMPSANYVWGKLLKLFGYKKYIIPDSCPDCYTVRDFCYDHPFGKYILATGSHVVTVIDGNYYDSWDSGNEVPIYYWKEI